MLKLTPKEIELLEMAKLGYKYKEIGAQLGIAQGTIKNRMQLIYAKLQSVNRVDAVVKAVKAGYISL